MACNASPPRVNYDYDASRVEKKTIYLTAFGTPCQYMHLLPEDSFITPSGSEETELSSDESINSKESSIRSIPIPSTSNCARKSIKEEILSDTEDVLKHKDTSKSKLKTKKRSSPSTKKWSGVEYPTSEDSGEDRQHRSRRRKPSNDSEDEDRAKARHRKECSTKSVKEEEEEEYKYTPGFSAAFGSFHCQVCDITVNSEVTYQTHLQGKRHMKALKAKAVPEVAIQSLNEPRLPPPLICAPITSSKRARRIPLREDSLIQLVAEDYNEGPLPGLSEVVEIRPVDGTKEIAYLCNLCEAQCVPNSIMKHLTGFKHYLRCLETIDAISYEKYRFSQKKAIETKVRRILQDYERRRGRGRIRVEQEVDDAFSMRGEAGLGWRDGDSLPSIAAGADGSDDVEFVSAMEHLDTSMSDFYCKACDAHMNNKAMWESHVRGKRHLKNVKKVPGESTSKIKSYHCPEETAHLMRLLDEWEGVDAYSNSCVIVGLDFIKETQNETGDLYNCYLCGACTSSYDIIEHLNQPKHKVKYLETINARGMENSIEQIKCLSDVSAFAKECMIDEECRNALAKYGEGKVNVYRSKNMYAPSTYGSRY